MKAGYQGRLATTQPAAEIFTGTPGGVGAGRDPQVFLKPSDVLVSTIEGIGEMRQECVSK